MPGACFIVLNIALGWVLGQDFVLGLAGLLLLNGIVLLVLQNRWIIPLYLLVAAPSIAFPIGTTGIASRLFVGNLLLVLLIVIGGVRTISRPQTEGTHYPASVLIPLGALALIGLISIVHTDLQPDPGVIYSFPHAAVPLIVVNGMEMVLLLGLPIVLLIVPGLMRTLADVTRMVRATTGLGLIYALGTIFAGPLGLYSQQTILDISRPQVFGTSSSVLGLLLVFFTCLALGQALYAKQRGKVWGWWLCTLIFGIAVIMSYGRTAWVTLLIAVLIMLGLRIKTLVVIPIILALLLLALVPGITDFFNPEKVYGADRLLMWQDAIAIWLRHPYFGIGAGNYQFFDIAYGNDVGGVAHNQYLEALAEMGVQGLLCLLWGLFALGRLILQRFQAATMPQGKAIALASAGYFIGLLVFGFFGDSFLPSVAGAGGTYAMIIASYHWFLLALVLTLPQWEQTHVVALEERCQQ